VTEDDQLGAHALKLLGEESMVAVLRALAEGVERPAELERRLPNAGHSLLMRRLRHLREHELVSCEHRPGSPPHAHGAGIAPEAHYALLDAGRELLEIAAQAARWERDWWTQHELRDSDGTRAIRLTADRHARKIALLLADGPLPSADLERHTPDLARSALRRRLRELVLARLLERRGRGRVRLYELTERARHLALVAMLAGRWEWRWCRPAHAAPARDLERLLRLLAPAAHIPQALTGVCQLRLDVGRDDTPDISLAARAGRLAVADARAGASQAVARASPQAWCETLLQRDGRIAISGDQVLLAKVMEALSAALLA
jgi:DNA-binding HxlR family transcriptional regulator